ncbi:MAG TPA: universal stress protein [Gaiellaceae bacterium]
METKEQTAATPPKAASVFERVLVGVDGSAESLAAVRQAATLAEGPITLLAAYELAAALVGGMGPASPAYLDEEPLRNAAEQALESAREEIPGTEATAKVARGRPWDALLAEIERAGDTLVAVGSHGTGRALGIVIGSTATELIHKAPCSVLVARTPLTGFPSVIVVGLDGSAESIAAYETAKALADRFDSKLEPVVASAGEDVDLGEVQRLVPDRVRGTSEDPVEALVAASAGADLVVVGSRGLRGVRALGSVSERVAHQAACSVLIVRREH